MSKQDIIRKLTSRKFWLSVAGFVSMLLIFIGKDRSTAEGVAALIMAGASVIGYAIGEGLADGGHTDVKDSHVGEAPDTFSGTVFSLTREADHV